MPDLLSVVLTLRPLPDSEHGAPLPAWWGRAAHALLLDVLAQADPALAARLHDGESGPRPFTVSTLIGRFRGGAFDPARPYSLRLTALTAEVSAILLAAIEHGPLAAGQTLQLDYRPFAVLAAAGPQAPADPPNVPLDAAANFAAQWSGSADYTAFSAPLLLSQRTPPRRLGLQFASPTAFKSGGKHVPMPLPDLVFGSLLDRWNAFAPIAFPPEVRQYAAECLAISRFDIAGRSVALKAGSLRVGLVGQCSYTSLNYDRYWMSVIGVLAEFARFSGLGVNAGMGLGQCRLLLEEGRE